MAINSFKILRDTRVDLSIFKRETFEKYPDRMKENIAIQGITNLQV